MKAEKRTSLDTTTKLIIDAVSKIDNPGTANLIKYLEESDFFTAQCHSHHCFKGGLAHHSLGTAWKMIETESELPEQSRFIVGLLHDICKSHHRDYDHIGRHHHGLRSVELLNALGFHLTSQEKYAISNHMHGVHQSWDEIKESQRLQLRKLVNECDHRDAATQPRNAENPYERCKRAFMNALGNMGLLDL